MLNPHTRHISEGKYIVGRRHLACRRELAEGEHSFRTRCESNVRRRFALPFCIALSVERPSVWQPQRTDRLPKRELAIWNNCVSTRRVRDRVTRRPVFPGSHNSLSINLKLVKLGGIVLIEVLSLAHAPLFQFSYNAQSVLSSQCSNTHTAVQMSIV